MQRHLVTFIGSAIAGALTFGVWPEMWKSYGILGGFTAATLVIGVTWFMNHWIGVIENPEGGLWVDQGLAILGAGMAWGTVRFWPVGGGFEYCCSAVYKVWPTLTLCLIGGALGGWAAHIAKRHAPLWRADGKEASK